MLRHISKLIVVTRHARRYSTSNSISITPLFDNARLYENKVAIWDEEGEHTYKSLFQKARGLAKDIDKKLDWKDNERILFLCPNNAKYVVVLWGIWMAGHTAVPLSHLHPESVLRYYVKDTQSRLLITAPEYEPVMSKVAQENGAGLYVLNDSLLEERNVEDYTHLLSRFDEDRNAFILYTSGTTGNPKGVVHTHKNVWVQTKALVDAWKWSPEDIMLHCLPLHHVHGTVCALFGPLHIGAGTVMLPKFSAESVWEHLIGKKGRKCTVFMAVPTIYAKLIDEYEKNHRSDKEYIRNYLKDNVRLMVSGSAPLPVPLYEKWYEISGHNLLERYGMTEVGICLSNKYDVREPGYVGVPLPGISVRLSDPEDSSTILLECKNEDGRVTTSTLSDESVRGELLVKGANVFKEYYNKPEATKKEFTADGWFKTGDTSEYVHDKGKFKILGRTSVDIIKSGGYKISALHIETKLLAHPNIKDVAVLGVKDETWGERIAAVVVLKGAVSMTLDELRRWASEHMPKYSLPTVLEIVEEIPKNAMGKVNKRELVKVFTLDK